MISTIIKSISEVANKEQTISMKGELGNKTPDFSNNSGLSRLENKIPNFESFTPEKYNKNENQSSENTSIIEVVENEPVIKLATRNSSLEGDCHPITGIPFNYSVEEGENGEKLGGVYPKFESILDIQLPDTLMKESDSKQFNYCNKQLFAEYEAGKLDTTKFSERQLEQIKNGDKPEGYTWHHHESKGKMQLVETAVHEQTGHSGGKSTWGGGSDAR